MKLLTATSSISGKKSYEPRDLCVLVRRIKSATPILNELQKAGVCTRIFGSEGFFERQEIIELVCALRLITNPEDQVALLTVLRSPIVDLPESFFVTVFEYLRETNQDFSLSVLRAFFESSHRQDQNLSSFFRFINFIDFGCGQIRQLSGFEVLERLLDTCSYLEAIATYPYPELCYSNVQKLKDMLLYEEGDLQGQIDTLWIKVKEAPKESLGEEEGELDAVKIMTIHQSKGLEFPVVFLADTSARIPSESADLLFDRSVGLALSHRGRPIATCAPSTAECSKQFPTPIQAVRAKIREKNVEELSRLLYVGLTRARDLVYFIDSRDPDKKQRQEESTLSGQFFRNWSDEVDNDLMPTIENIVNELGRTKAFLHSPKSTQDEKPTQKNDIETRRLLPASDLTTLNFEDLCAPRGSYIRFDDTKVKKSASQMSASDSGKLAHSLIELTSKQLAVDEFEDSIALDEALDASLRFMGYFLNDHEELVRKCRKTIESVIWPMIKTGFTFEFEVPLKYEYEQVVVKGFADAIVRRDDIVCVIDFKSSQAAAVDPKTKLQLNAYCGALWLESRQQIYFSSSVIGDESPLEFKHFDETQKRDFDNHLMGFL